MTAITDFNFEEDDFTAADLIKLELLKSKGEKDLNNLAELLNKIVAAKVTKLSQEKDEFYSKQLASKELETDTFYNHSPSGYFSTAANGIINKINDTLLVWLGYTREDIIGKVTWQSLLSVGGKMYFETHYSPLLQLQGFVQEISFEMVKKDKTRLPILINTKQIRDENGKVQINYSTVFDVSQRKSYEQELLTAKSTAEEQNKLINETNKKLLASEKELKSKIEEVKSVNENLNKLVEYTFKNASIPIYFVLEDASIYNFNDIAAENLGYTNEELHALKVHDLDKDYDEKKWASVWAKLKEKKKITVETQQKKKDGTLVDVIVTANYVKYGDLELNCSFILDITEKKKQEEQLKLFDFTLRNSSLPTYYINEDASFYDFNDAGCKQLGYTKEEFKTLSVFNTAIGQDENSYRALWGMIKEKGQINFEAQQKRKDGSLIDVNIISSYVIFGKKELNCTYVVDVTEKKKQEKELKLIDFTFSNSAIPIFLIKEDSSIYNINEAAAKGLAYSQEELKGKKIIEIDDNFDKDKWELHWADVKAKGSITIETTNTKKDGTIGNFIININYLKHGDLELLCSYAIDITEKKKLEQQLNLLGYSYKHTDSAMFFLDVDGLYIDFNQATANLLGYSYEEFTGKTVFDVNPMVTKENWAQRWEELKDVPNQNFQVKLQRKDGTLIDVEINTNSIELNGAVVNFGFYKDITEKKKLEDSLKLSAFTIDNAAWGLAYIKADGTLYNCNVAFAKLYGNTSLEEMKTKTAFDFGSAYTIDTWKQYWDDLKQKKSLHYIAKRTKNDGTSIDLEINANMIQFGDLELNCIYVNDVTEKKKAEERLKLSDYIIQKATTAIYLLKPDGSIYDFNEAAYTMLGYTKEEFGMLHQMDLDPRLNLGIILEGFEVLRREGKVSFQSTMLKKSGALIDVEITTTFIVYDGLELKCSFISEITEKKKAEAEIYSINELLQRQTNRLLLATKSAQLGIWDRDLENDSIFWDEGMYKLYGITANEFKTNNEAWIARLHEEDRAKTLNEMQLNIANKNEFNSEFRIVWNDASIHYIKTAGFIQRIDGKPKRIIGVSWDVTKDKKAELEKETLLKELVENNLELKQFTYITSHNLRAPLTNLVTICNIIQPENITDAFTLQLIEGFKKSTYHLNDTLNDLMEILIIKEDRNRLKVQLTFEEIFKKITESLSISLQEQRVIINADFTAAPSVIFANEYLESVFLNLVTNSVKYRHPDRDPIITIKTSREPNGDTKLTFADNGIGINMAFAKDKIFGLYKRFHNNADSKGIGLYLVHSQITTLGGTIEVESEVNIGTTFTITFK